jgi:hypothetical protein
MIGGFVSDSRRVTLQTGAFNLSETKDAVLRAATVTPVIEKLFPISEWTSLSSFPDRRSSGDIYRSSDGDGYVNASQV